MKTAVSPWLVLVVAIVLPGMGQVLNNQPKRGLVMVFYMLLLGLLTYTLADTETSLVGKFAGGVFVYAMSVVDAYRAAALRRQARTSSSVGCAEGAEPEVP